MHHAFSFISLYTPSQYMSQKHIVDIYKYLIYHKYLVYLNVSKMPFILVIFFFKSLPNSKIVI